MQGGQMTAAEGAKQLGVSRKTYYEWENRGLAGMMAALSNGRSGRPSSPVDAEKERLLEEAEQLRLENELLQVRLGIQKMLAQEEPEGLPPLRKSKGLKTSKKKT